MRRILCVCLALAALCAMTGTASAEGWTGSIQGGASLPSGDFSSADKGDAATGWSVGGAMDYAWKENWSLGFDGSFGQNAMRAADENTYSTWQAGAHARYFLPAAASMPVRWYGVVGAGVYGVTMEAASATSSFEFSDKRAGARLGFGGLWWANPSVGIHAEVDHHAAFLDKDDSSSESIQYTSAWAGVTFRLPSNPRP